MGNFFNSIKQWTIQLQKKDFNRTCKKTHRFLYSTVFSFEKWKIYFISQTQNHTLIASSYTNTKSENNLFH